MVYQLCVELCINVIIVISLSYLLLLLLLLLSSHVTEYQEVPTFFYVINNLLRIN